MNPSHGLRTWEDFEETVAADRRNLTDEAKVVARERRMEQWMERRMEAMDVDEVDHMGWTRDEGEDHDESEPTDNEGEEDDANNSGNNEEDESNYDEGEDDDEDNGEDDDEDDGDDEGEDYEIYDEDGEGDVIEIAMYIDFAPMYQPEHVWDEPIEGAEPVDYWQEVGYQPNHRVLTPEERAQLEIAREAELRQQFGNLGYESDFVPDELYEADLRWEDYGERMTDPESEPVEEMEVGEIEDSIDELTRRMEEMTLSEEEPENWDEE